MENDLSAVLVNTASWGKGMARMDAYQDKWWLGLMRLQANGVPSGLRSDSVASTFE